MVTARHRGKKSSSSCGNQKGRCFSRKRVFIQKSRMLPVIPLILRCFLGDRVVEPDYFFKYWIPPDHPKESMEMTEKCLKSIPLETGIGGEVS